MAVIVHVILLLIWCLRSFFISIFEIPSPYVRKKDLYTFIKIFLISKFFKVDIVFSPVLITLALYFDFLFKKFFNNLYLHPPAIINSSNPCFINYNYIYNDWFSTNIYHWLTLVFWLLKKCKEYLCRLKN